jgi:hypothetical protein
MQDEGWNDEGRARDTGTHPEFASTTTPLIYTALHYATTTLGHPSIPRA